MQRRTHTRLLALAGLVVAVVPAPASASLLRRTAAPPKRGSTSRVINGTPASAGEYPAQAGLYVDADDNGMADHLCGGTLVGTRQVLTAAHCAVGGLGDPLLPRDFFVHLGVLDQNDFPASTPHPVATVDVDSAYVPSTHRNDIAMLTLSEPAGFEPARAVEPGDEALWAPGTLARIVGWGTTAPHGYTSDLLLEADVPIVGDTACGDAYGDGFDSGTMVCAADPAGTATPHDTCQGDSGGPLYVRDYGSTADEPVFATAGVVSWGIGCGNPAYPGVYARIGEGALSTWTLHRVPRADYGFDHAPRATERVTMTSTSTDPDGPDYFTEFRWDFDEDGQFDDASGKGLDVTFPSPGERVVGLEASKPGGDHASAYFAFEVGAAPDTTDGGATGSDSSGTPDTGQGGGSDTGSGAAPPNGNGGGSGGAGGTGAVSGGGQGQPAGGTTTRAATITAAKSLRARRGRFSVRVGFPASAKAGTAVIAVLLKGKKVGSGRVAVKPSGTSVAKVKLTRDGLRRLAHAGTLKLTLRLSGGGVTAQRTLTLRR